MTYALSNTADATSLRNIGIEFYPPTGLLSGYPTLATINAYVPITATDIYGSTSTIYFTITVSDITT